MEKDLRRLLLVKNCITGYALKHLSNLFVTSKMYLR